MNDPQPADSFSHFVAQAAQHAPSLVLVLGSGLGQLVERVEVLASVSYGDLPGLCLPTVHGHRGRLTLAEWAGRTLLLCEGRLHFYEGHPWEQVTALMRFAAELGVHGALLTNAAGGIHEALHPGSIMIIRDHLDLTHPHWWRKPRQPSPYSPRLVQVAKQAAGAPILAGVYGMCTGPQYETPAEVRAIRTWGADAVGMSTGKEVLAAHALGMECLALSCITNRAAGLGGAGLSHREVMENAAQTAERMANLIEQIIRKM